MRIRTTTWMLMAGAVALAAAGPSLSKGTGKEQKNTSVKHGTEHATGHDDNDDDGEDGEHGGKHPDLSFGARLSGFLETPASISTAGTGKLTLRLNAAENSADFELTYSGLEGTTVSAAQIQLGQPATSGGVMVVLCPTATTPACPGPAGGTVTGTLVAADVVGPSAQGVAAGEFAEFVNALRKHAAYVNVLTDLYATGEIRGNIH
jgi:CHRD domain-containing protein